MLRVGERIVKNPRCIKKEVVKFLKNLYSDDGLVCLKLNGEAFPRLSREQAESLEIMHSEEEIKRAVWSCESSRAPGYDGFNLGFVQKMWGTIGDDFVRMIMDFFEQGELPKAVNITWVALLPKVEGALELKDFRPIRKGPPLIKWEVI